MECYYCRNKLTEKEIKRNIDEAEYCCQGLVNQCGCMGMPIDPPVCIKCCEDEK